MAYLWEAWAPDIDVFQRGNDLVVRADLPGLKKDDIKVDVTEDSITIRGERKSELEEEREGVYRSERSYGSFSRVIPLPEGTIADQARTSPGDWGTHCEEVALPGVQSRTRRVPVDAGAAGTLRCLDMALALARSQNARLTILHVLVPILLGCRGHGMKDGFAYYHAPAGLTRLRCRGNRG